MKAAREVAARRNIRGNLAPPASMRSSLSFAALDIELEFSGIRPWAFDFRGRYSVRGEFQSRDRCNHLVVDVAATRAAAFHPSRNDHGLDDLPESGLVFRRRVHDLQRLVGDEGVDLAGLR